MGNVYYTNPLTGQKQSTPTPGYNYGLPTTTASKPQTYYNQYGSTGEWAGAQPPTPGQKYWSSQTKSYITAPQTTGFKGGQLMPSPTTPTQQTPSIGAPAQTAPAQSQVPNLNTTIGQGTGYAGKVLETAFDPQKDLYNRTVQQLQDQIRVGQAARGVTMSPYGAGLENQAMGNFNIDWQNAQLARQSQGLNAYATGVGPGMEYQRDLTGANQWERDFAENTRRYGLEFAEKQRQADLERQRDIEVARLGGRAPTQASMGGTSGKTSGTSSTDQWLHPERYQTVTDSQGNVTTNYIPPTQPQYQPLGTNMDEWKIRRDEQMIRYEIDRGKWEEQNLLNTQNSISSTITQNPRYF